jgi:hypothetical protein
MKKVENKEYQIVARVVVLAGITVTAESFEAAVEKSKRLSIADFISINEDLMEGSIRIVSINKNSLWSTDDC